MEDEEDDDIYAPEDVVNGTPLQVRLPRGTLRGEKTGDDLEEGEEEGEEIEEEDSDSDIDIITERKDDPKTEAPQPQRVSIVKATPVRTSTPDSVNKPAHSPAVKLEPSAKATPPRSGSSYPAIKSSRLDIDAKPIYESNGKPITEIDMDADFSEEDKPWRRPGTDQTDYFNYGFDEFTWASYCLKQTSLRKEVADSAKQMEEMQDFLSMPGGGMPGISGAPSAPGMPPMPGMDMPPEMQQMMASMIANGQDPTTMDPMMMMQMMQGAQGGANTGSGQNFGGGQGYGQQAQNQQQVGYGYGAGSGVGGGGGGGGGRNQGGRGRGSRNW